MADTRGHTVVGKKIIGALDKIIKDLQAEGSPPMTDPPPIPTNCDDCGACCLGQNLLPLTGNMLDAEDGVSPWIPAPLRQELEAIATGPMFGDDGCACVWLDRATGRCKHHVHRPSTCREFEIGGEGCMKRRAEVGL